MYIPRESGIFRARGERCALVPEINKKKYILIRTI